MKFSVIITSHNYEQYLADCINSVLRQTYKNVECIVVDDGSTDGSRQVLSRFPEIKTILKHNTGQADSAAAASREATGDIVILLDCDDMLRPNACERILAHWEPDTVSVSFRLNVFSNGRSTGQTLPTHEYVRGDPRQFILRYGDLSAGPNSGNAFLKSVFDEVFAKAVGLTGNTVDCWMYLSAPFLGRVKYVSEILGDYRIHGRNISLIGKPLDFRGAKWLLFNFYSAQKTALAFAEQKGAALPRYRFLRGPYYIKYYLLLGDFEYPSFDIPHHSRAACALEGIREFWSYPYIKLAKRLINIGVVTALFLSPRSARALIAKWVYGMAVTQRRQTDMSARDAPAASSRLSN
jgi:glycosyltransferase involved in cell wall biosynthesis